jgi:hypothetical protein
MFRSQVFNGIEEFEVVDTDAGKRLEEMEAEDWKAAGRSREETLCFDFLRWEKKGERQGGREGGGEGQGGIIRCFDLH